jgi:hypothetical protein
MTDGDPTVVGHRSGVLVSTLPQAFQETAALQPDSGAICFLRRSTSSTPRRPARTSSTCRTLTE